MAIANWFKSTPSPIEVLQAQIIADLKADNQELRAEIAKLNSQHRAEMADWRDAFAAIQFQAPASNQPSLLEEMQEPEETAMPTQNFFAEFSRIHGNDNLDLVAPKESANG